MYSRNKVIQMLVNNVNATMQLLDDTKEFRIDYNREVVECWRVRRFLSDTLLSTETFDDVIIEAKGIVK